ncbi:MAG: DUF6325 family protein [Acidobacteriota bacterium]
MTLGPIEMVVIAFPGSRFSGEIRPRILDLIERDIVNVVDGLFIRKEIDGTVVFVELMELTDDPEAIALGSLLSEQLDLLSDEDVDELAENLQPGSSALALVFEHTWMKPVRDAIAAADGVLLADIHVPAEVVDEVLASVAGS